MRARLAGLTLFAFLVTGGFYAYAPAMMKSGVYRMLISEQTTIGNTMPKTGGTYSLLGSTGQLGGSGLVGGRYTVTWGVVNSWRPPQATVDTAHVYPNPCYSKRACTGITFTRLTLNATINIYTVSGEKVKKIVKNNNIDSVGWDLRNEDGKLVTSGLYLYIIHADGSSKKGKIVVVR
jgi:hypothetical protein